MKKYLSIAIGAYLAFTVTACSEQPSTDAAETKAVEQPKETAKPVSTKAVEATGNAKMSFENSTWDFGTIKQGATVEYIFKFENTGTEPLIITKAKGSCGCTAPKWPKEPIAPGETGEIQVKFNSRGKKGTQKKTVTIWANTTPNQTRLRVNGEVEAPVAAEQKNVAIGKEAKRSSKEVRKTSSSVKKTTTKSASEVQKKAEETTRRISK